MEFFLNKVSQQAVTFAIRSGVIVTSQFAIKQCGRYISKVKGADKKELLRLQERLQTKIKIISPAIDLVEIISARGNTSLESALTLTKDLRREIQELGVRLAKLTDTTKGATAEEAKAVQEDIKQLLAKIEEAVPFISLAVATSGVNISTSIPHNVSPSRLLQASTLLTAGDTAYTLNPENPAQIGTTFTLSLYMLFGSHSHRQDHVSATDLTWQEVINKCKVKLKRTPLFYDDGETQMRGHSKADEYCYELFLIEDLDDGRVHEREGRVFEEVAQAGLVTHIPVHQISKMFYTTSGKLLGIDESSSPILLLKRDRNATAPRRMADLAQLYEYSDSDSDYGGTDAGNSSMALHAAPLEELEDFPRHLDQEWLAFEVHTDDAPDDASSATLSSRASSPSLDDLPSTLSALDLAQKPTTTTSPSTTTTQPAIPLPARTAAIKSTLSILECLLRLTILQNYQQANHLSVHDELLHLFLSDEAWGGSKEQRRREREHARERIGFDPFGDTPGSAQRRSRRGTPAKAVGASIVGAEAMHGLHQVDSGPPVTPRSDPRVRVSAGRERGREEWTPDRQLEGAWEDSPVLKR